MYANNPTGELTRVSAEGATAPETLRPQDRGIDKNLERGVQASAEGIAISGKRTERGIKGALLWCVDMMPANLQFRRV